MENSLRYQQLYTASKVPLLQNCVYADPLQAKSAGSGCLNIVHDLEAGITINAAFDEKLTQYDQGYDNSVPSEVFMRYYDEIADYLMANYQLKKGTIFDIGCGKGTFLQRCAGRYGEINGIGIDPSYQGPSETQGGRLQFIAEHFSDKHILKEITPAIVLCRHVIEHISSPSKFLECIFEPFSHKRNVPVFIEVPDISWIVENTAFWDFCHEHVNYFSHHSLRRCVTEAGGVVTKITSAFGGQYIWCEALLNPTDAVELRTNAAEGENRENDASDIAVDDSYFKERVKITVERIKKWSMEREIVIWGMATKGIMYSLNLVENGVTALHCVDINVAKQGKYTPLLGLPIRSPAELPRDGRYIIVCMNPNYTSEIEGTCHELGIDGVLLSPDGQLVECRE